MGFPNWWVSNFWFSSIPRMFQCSLQRRILPKLPYLAITRITSILRQNLFWTGGFKEFLSIWSNLRGFPTWKRTGCPSPPVGDGCWGGQSSRWTFRGIWRPVFAGARRWHCWISSSWTSWSFNYGDHGDGVPIYLTVSLWVDKYAVSERFWRLCVQFPLHPKVDRQKNAQFQEVKKRS